MNEEQKKRLTVFIGECWHEDVPQPPPSKIEVAQGFLRCALCACGKYSCFHPNHTFLTWPDLGACMEALVREGKWEEFYWYPIISLNIRAESGRHAYPGQAGYVAWLFRPVNEAGEAHFCALVAEFLGSKKKSNISYTYPGWPPADIPDGPYTGAPNGED